jgi:TRAP-type C4-dicarboxylate transport system permease small subunit
MTLLEKISIFINRVFLVMAGVAIIALMFLAGINVILRTLGSPYSGTYELVGFLGAILIAFALGETQRRKDHVIVDLLTSKFPPAVNRFTDRIHYLATMVFFAVIAWQVMAYGMIKWRTGEVSETLKIIYHPVVFCVALGFALLAFNLLVDFLLTFQRPQERKTP